MTRVYGQVLWALSSTDCVCAAGATSVVKLVTLLESAGRISILEYFGASTVKAGLTVQAVNCRNADGGAGGGGGYRGGGGGYDRRGGGDDRRGGGYDGGRDRYAPE